MPVGTKRVIGSAVTVSIRFAPSEAAWRRFDRAAPGTAENGITQPGAKTGFISASGSWNEPMPRWAASPTGGLVMSMLSTCRGFVDVACSWVTLVLFLKLANTLFDKIAGFQL
jgi:hypothetical protein